MTAPIRVLMITSDWPDHASWGGTATFISRQVDFLRAAGVDVDVFRFRGVGNPLRYAAAWLGVQRRLRRRRYDLVHAQFGQSGLLALPKRLPLVVTFRGDDLEGVLNNTTGRLTPRGRLLPLLSRVVARRADATIVVSAHMKAFLHRQARPHVIPSGLDLERFRLIPQAEARGYLGLPSDRRLVLFVGSPTSSRKRYDLARQAVAIVERLRDLAGCEVSADDRPDTIAAALVRALSHGKRIAGRERMLELDEHLITERVIGVYRSVLAHGNGNARRGSAP